MATPNYPRQRDAVLIGIESMRNDEANEELQESFRKVDSEASLELIDDMALAEQALEDYEAHGIECTTFYSEYRAKRLASKTSLKA
ncbi:MAG: hypothetical protein F4Y50_03775 [Dehalococcoidia bacterium]|nr:hypothetical protein [Chloroflexota bacterium]MXY43169.1 hypothetical protein [Dehalococcoidia bacterium]MYD51392.1 hypothetical protein [Dehalococcoidia bacterium]